MKKSPLISVIIPVYNVENYLKRCLDSIINQTYKNLQIILVNDGSSDGSGSICDEYSAKDNRIICVHQKNQGVSAARNKGISLATGDFYHFPDSDDYIEKDTYEYILNQIYENNCDAVAFEHFVTFKNQERTHELRNDFYGVKSRDESQLILMRGMQFCWNKFFKKELLDGLYFRSDIFRGEDTLFVAEAFSKANKICFIKRPLYHYVQSDESACRGVFRPSQFTILKLYDAYEPIYREKYPCVWNYFILFMQEVIISLYYDAYSDINSKKYKKNLKELYLAVKEHSRLVSKARIMSKKQKIKIAIFKFSPKLFCFLHSKIHKL